MNLLVGGDRGRIRDLVELADGDIVVAGSITESGMLRSSAWVARIDPSGIVEWQVALGGAGQGDDLLADVEQMPGGGLLLAGNTISAGPSGQSDILLAKIDELGVVEWTRLAGAAGADANPRLLRLNDGWLVSGNTTSSGAGGSDAWLLRLDEDVHLGPGDCGLIADAPVPKRTTGLAPVAVALTLRATASPGDVVPMQDDVLAPISSVQCTFGMGLPGEISPPGSRLPLRFLSRSELAWDDSGTSGSDSYLVYRGALPDLRLGRAGDCLAGGIGSTTFVDPDPPLPGGSFYLVGGRNATGDGPLGTDSFGVPRVPRTPCP